MISDPTKSLKTHTHTHTHTHKGICIKSFRCQHIQTHTGGRTNHKKRHNCIKQTHNKMFQQKDTTLVIEPTMYNIKYSVNNGNTKIQKVMNHGYLEWITCSTKTLAHTRRILWLNLEYCIYDHIFIIFCELPSKFLHLLQHPTLLHIYMHV